MPDSVKAYYDAQWWIFLHVAWLAYPALALLGVLGWWHQRHEDDEQESGLTVINLRKDDDDGGRK